MPRPGLQTLTLFKTKTSHFATLFKTGDTTPCSAPHTRIGQIRECPPPAALISAEQLLNTLPLCTTIVFVGRRSMKNEA